MKIQYINNVMDKREKLIELLETVRYTTNDIEKVADLIMKLFNNK